MSDDIKELLNHLVFTPRQSQIEVDFDLGKKIFILSVPIYVSKISLPQSIKEYVEARKTRTFKPHATSFHFKGERIVNLIQEIPFQWGIDPGSRKDILEFHQLAKRCHRMLNEMAIEEQYKAALCLDSDLGG